MFSTNGSLVEARQNPMLYTIIVAILGFLLLLALIGLILQKIRSLRSSSNWLEAHKNEPTTSKNIANVAKLADLTAAEKKILTQLCQKFKPQNIEYLIRDSNALSDLLHQEYDELLKKNASADIRATFFSLLYKLEKARDNLLFIKSTRNLPAGQTFTYIDSTKTQWTLTLDRNTAQEMVLNIPRTLAQSDKKPAQLTKCLFSFKTDSGITYTVSTRVIRYEEEKPGKFVLIASSNNTLTALQRRHAKRVAINQACQFAAAKFDTKGDKPQYDIQPHIHDGQLQDISITGCSISCPLSIKDGQYLSLTFTLPESTIQNTAIGYIVVTKKTADGKQFILHIKFADIKTDVKNRISAFIYGYKNTES